MSQTAGVTRVPCWIDNAPTLFNPALFIEVPIDRSREERPLSIVQGASEPVAVAAVQSAAVAREQWSKTSSVERLRILQQVSQVFERRRESFLLYLNLELGLGPEEAEEVFNYSVSELTRTSSRFAASAFSNRHIAGLGPRDSPIATTPTYTGATVIVASPSLPLLVQTISNSLSSGRTLVLVASNNTPRIQHSVVMAFEEVGLPAGCLNKIHLRKEDEARITERMMQDAGVQMVEVCDDRKEVQERLLELGRRTATHVVARVPVSG